MTKLIADAGATKTIWLMPGAFDGKIMTRGIQPVLMVDSEIESVIYDELFTHPDVRKAGQILFYGSGCGAWNQAERVRHILRTAFSKAEIEVRTDIEGAGRAVFQRSEGIILISGTGSSAGYMRGGEMVDRMNQPVWPQGDLGSGAHIGALILNDYFEGKSPESIKKLIDDNRRLSEDDLFVQFQNPGRSKQIAAKAMKDVVSIAGLTGDADEYMQDLSLQAFREWFDVLYAHFRSALQHVPVAICGSTGAEFETQLRLIFEEKGVTLHKVIKDPAEGLLRYHHS